MTKLTQNSLITYITIHKGNCDCDDCKYFGGVRHLFETFSSDDFTEKSLRKIWAWLKYNFKNKGTCELDKLDFINDPTAPKLSDVTQCHLDANVTDEKGYPIPLKEKIFI